MKEYAYGSNMCSGRFRAYDVSPEREGRALRYFERIALVFNKRSQDGSGKANVEPHEPALTHVWGVLYTIPDADLATLDRGEGQGYHRVRMPARITDADIAEALKLGCI